MNGKAIVHAYDENGLGYQFRDVVGGGGEGVIYAVPGQPNSVAKIFTKLEPDTETKIRAMCWQEAPHPAMAWPQAALFDKRRQFVGFLMTRFFDVVQLHEYFTTVGRDYPVWREAWDMARQIAEIVSAIHARGYVVGDLNERNILVSEKKRAVLVDCDSMQMNLAGTQYLCHVGRPEYLAPELQGRNLGELDRAPYSDNWSLAILIGQLLFIWRNPFYGGSGNTQPADNIRDGRTWLLDYQLATVATPEPRELLSPEIRALFQKAFGAGLHEPAKRPAAMEWACAMRQGHSQLVTCTQHGRHDFFKGQACYWCRFPHAFFGPAGGRRAAAAASVTAPVSSASVAAPVLSSTWIGGWLYKTFGAKTGGVLFTSALLAALCTAALYVSMQAGETKSLRVFSASTPLRADGVLRLPNGTEGYAILTLTPLDQQQPKTFQFRLELAEETVTAVAVYQADQAVFQVGTDYRFRVQTHKDKTFLVAEQPLQGSLEIYTQLGVDDGP